MHYELDSAWICSIDDKLTFCGVLEEYYDDCAKHWMEKTRSQYNRDYNEKILPNLPGHDETPIEAYTREDYDAAIVAIAEKGQARKGDIFVPYADATLQHYRHLIEVVTRVASEKGICDNVLWGSAFTLPELRTADDEVKERVALQKSLSPSQEAAVVGMLLSQANQRGQNLGLLLMFALGLRNNEACGANFGDIRPMQLHPECKALWVYKTTVIGSNVLKSSGKTRNADRIIPIPSALERYIDERRNYLEQEVDFAPDEGMQCIDDLPIACVEDDYKRLCSASQLTAAGREMFRQIRMNENQLAYIDAELSQETKTWSTTEKDPTAYLLRRNFGTHLHILGLTEAEIEYIIGHDITDAYETRNEFVNEEKLYEIKLKMDQRPLLNDVYEEPERTVLALVPGECRSIEGVQPHVTRVRLRPGQLRIHLEANEPLDSLSVRFAMIPQSAVVRKQSFVTATSPKYERSIDITKKYHKRYGRYQNKDKP